MPAKRTIEISLKIKAYSWEDWVRHHHARHTFVDELMRLFEEHCEDNHLTITHAQTSQREIQD